MISKKRLVILFVFLGLFGSLAYLFLFKPVKGTKLIDGIKSYQSIEEFKRTLILKGYREEEFSGENFEHIFLITVPEYADLNHSGELVSSFYNNRLLETRFYPDEIDEYIKILAKNQGIEFVSSETGGIEAHVEPYTRIWIAVDYEERKYVGWSDTRLDRQLAVRDFIKD
jgi:hypothetical protein